MDKARDTGMDLKIKMTDSLRDRMSQVKKDKKGRWKTLDVFQVAKEQAVEIERLKEKCDKQAMVLRRIYVEQFPNTWYVAGGYGEKDQNNLPKYIEVVPAWGVDWSHIYERTDRTIGGMGS